MPKISERLCRHIDGMMRKSAKIVNEKDIENSQRIAIIIFKYINDKDVFHQVYFYY